MPNKISISNDIALPLYPPLCSLHEFLGQPPPPPAPPLYIKTAPCAEIPVPMFWPPGFALGQNKLTTTVLHKGLPIVQDGHDCGALIVHVQLVASPLNMLTVVHIPFSSRKSNFSSSKVISQGKATACCTFISWPPAPMTSCWDPVSPPLSDAPTSHLNTVVITMSWADIIIGWVAVIATMGLEFALSRLPGGDPPGNWGNVAMQFIGKIIPIDRNGAIGWAGKQALGLLTGAARLAFTDGPVDVKIQIGAPFLQGEAGVSRDSSGNYSGVAGVRSANRSGEATYDEGQWSTKREQGGLGGPAGGTDSQTTSGGTTRTSTTTPSWNPTRWGAPL